MKAPGLYGGAHIVVSKTRDSFIKKVCGKTKGYQHRHSPDDPGGSGLVITDVGEPMDRGRGEKLIHLPPQDLHAEQCGISGWNCKGMCVCVTVKKHSRYLL